MRDHHRSLGRASGNRRRIGTARQLPPGWPDMIGRQQANATRPYTLPAMSRLFPKQAPCAGYAQIALEKGIDTAPLGLTYAVPPPLGDLQVGQRVIVPLGRRHKPVPGYIVARSSDCDRPAAQVKSILKRDPNGLSVPSDLVDLAQWMANYYCCPLGMVFATMLPAAVKRGTGRIMRQVVLLQPPEPLEQDAVLSLVTY